MARKQPFQVTVDLDADAAYILMTNRRVAESRVLGDGTVVDLDDMGIVVGVEVLALDARIPFQRLIEEFHVHTDDVEYLRLLQPTISYALLQHSSDGASYRNELKGSLIPA